MPLTEPHVTTSDLLYLAYQIEKTHHEIECMYSELSHTVWNFYSKYDTASKDNLHCDGFLNKSKVDCDKLKMDCEAYVDYLRKYAKEITPDNYCEMMMNQKITW